MALLTAFDELTDPRSNHTRLYPLKTLVFLTISAVVSDCDSFTDIEEFGRLKVDWLKKYVECPEGRTPSHDTLGDFFSRLDPEQFQRCFINWTSQVCGLTEGELVAIDGKTLRGSYDKHSSKTAIHMISAWAGANELVLGQLKTNEKSNEITAIPALLRVLDLKGAIVSIDAMGCQKNIANQIIAQDADYILALKANQPELHEQVKVHFNYTNPHSSHTDITKGHGRIEKRKCTVLDNLTLLDEASQWPGIKAVIKIESSRESLLSGEIATQTRYYITSRVWEAKKANQLIRQHWAIENKLHWTLDVNFNEDASRVRKGHADQNLSIIRRIALNLIKLDKNKKPSQRIKRKQAAWSDNLREQIMRV